MATQSDEFQQRRFTEAEYNRMLEAGVLAPEEQAILHNGSVLIPVAAARRFDPNPDPGPVDAVDPSDLILTGPSTASAALREATANMNAFNQQIREERSLRSSATQWFPDILASLERLPWRRPDWSSENPRPLSPVSVTQMIVLLLHALPPTAPAPDLIPNWDGGIQASWEYGDIYLEVECSPEQEPRWAFVDERAGRNIAEDVPLYGTQHRFEARVRDLMEAVHA